jgi:protein-tyrosine-phosphatase
MVRRTIKEKNILFLCEDNAASSQMAEAIAKRLAPPETRIFSAGISPKEIPPQVTAVLQELGVNISGQRPKPVAEVPLEDIDLVITLSPEMKENRPSLSSRAKLVHWTIPDAKGVRGGEAAMNEVYRYLRDEIDKRVAALFLDYWQNTASS